MGDRGLHGLPLQYLIIISPWVTTGSFKPDSSDSGSFPEILNKRKKVIVEEKVVNKEGGN